MERGKHLLAAGAALALAAVLAGCGKDSAAVPAGQPTPILVSPPPQVTLPSGKKVAPPPPGMRLGPPPGWHR